jgi:hypothetical protein
VTIPLHVVDELLVNIRRACHNARNHVTETHEGSILLATVDHIDNLAQEARTALGTVTHVHTLTEVS